LSIALTMGTHCQEVEDGLKCILLEEIILLGYIGLFVVFPFLVRIAEIPVVPVHKLIV